MGEQHAFILFYFSLFYIALILFISLYVDLRYFTLLLIIILVYFDLLYR